MVKIALVLVLGGIGFGGCARVIKEQVELTCVRNCHGLDDGARRECIRSCPSGA